MRIIIISSAYAPFQRNHPNPGWSERLAICQQHVGDDPPCVLAQGDVGELHVVADRGHHDIPRPLCQFGLGFAQAAYIGRVDPVDPDRRLDRYAGQVATDGHASRQGPTDYAVNVAFDTVDGSHHRHHNVPNRGVI